ncbi:MAG: nucleotidyltransferase family protein [Myxococcota bacterium]
MDDAVARLTEELAGRPDVRLAAVFGSAARGELSPKSDVDVALRLTRPVVGWELGGLVADLSKAVGRRVDVVFLDDPLDILLKLEISKGVQIAGRHEDWVEFRRAAFREWREWGPRWRRCTDARIKRLLEHHP